MEQKDVWCSSVLTAASVATQPLFPASMSIISDATSSITAEGDRQLPVDSSTTTDDNPVSTNNAIWSQILSRGPASGGNDNNNVQRLSELLPPAPASTVRPAPSTEFLVPDDWEIPIDRSFGFHGVESSTSVTVSNSLAAFLSYPSLLPDDRLSSSTAVSLPDFPPHDFPQNRVKQEYQMSEYSHGSNAAAAGTTANTSMWLQGSNRFSYQLREPERPSLTKIDSDRINRASLPFHLFDSSSATNNSFMGNNAGGYNFTSTQDLLPAGHASHLRCFDGNASSSPTALLPEYIHNVTGQPSLTTTVIPREPVGFESLNNNSKDQQLASSSNCISNRFPNIDVSSTPSFHNTSEQKQNKEELTGSNKRTRIESTGSASSGLKVRKEKLGDRITSLQQLVSPFGKTDTASVLLEAIGYIKFLQEQVQVLSMPYMKATDLKRPRGSSSMAKEEGEFLEEPIMDLRSRGLCLVPVSCTLQVANDNGADFWTPSLGSGYR